jgi:LmbE family N-acetylglucosaminyl deacetylase
MHWIYLSPHLDDAVYSCGGLIWQQTRAGDRVEVWTLCAGDPPDDRYSPFAQELHARWETPQDSVARRRDEDRRACLAVGAAPRYFPVPDCIYRRPGLDYWNLPQAAPPAAEQISLYPDREALFGPLHPLEAGLPEQAAQRLAGLVPAGARLVSPLTLGGHADHRLTRQVAESLSAAPWYYADYPYAHDHLEQADALAPPGWCKIAWPLEAAALEAWMAGMSAHATQVSTFWSGLDDLREHLQDYVLRLGGGALWQPYQNRCGELA